ncbi:hypothetical protein PR001_g18066 [Phytophthora rubi]|uniref:Uncharacterized protein n=2 Tax=Phytophthora rubi TaxID=129364 RepID=A0A6A3KH25_9STRA|nr:hypothetical protein PR001_g18066 [Phytophthora rubi]
MEYLSSSSNPNNQDSLPSETLKRAHDEVAAQDASTEARKEEEESDFLKYEAGASQNAPKKQKVESNDYQAQIDTLLQEIAEVKERLASSPTSSTHEIARKCIEAKQTAATMKRKLAEHFHWMQRVTSLMETAPLLHFAVAASDEQGNADASRQRSLESLDEWLGESKEHPHSRLVLDERLRAAVITCQENVSRLLCDAMDNQTPFQLSLQFESHGWEIATGILVNDHMGFRCHRVLPAELDSKAKEVAMALWTFVESDEIFRTFVPLVQDSIIAHQGTDCSLSCRMLQLSQEMSQKAVATVETIGSTRDDNGEESFHRGVIQNTAPPVKLDLGLQMSKLNMHNKFLMGARVTKTEEGVDVFIAGSARFDLPCYCDPAFDLLQYFVSYLPAYEDLHLTALTEDKLQSDGLV